MNWERVYTINEYHDGPVLGVADLGGKPHVFELVFDEDEDEWSDQFRVMPIDADLLALVLEDWEIWLRWSKAFREGKVAAETHPALPEDGARHQALKRLIGDRLVAPPGISQLAHARFHNLNEHWDGGSVEWLP